MAKLSQLQQAYQNPNMRKFLDFIAQAEGVKHGYNTMFGNERFGNLGAHPNIKKTFKQTDGTTNFTTAAGRYQFLKGTWDNLANQYGFKDFSPRAQDLGAIALISGRGALNDVLNGNWQGAIGKLGQEWASLPSSKYKQGKRSWEFANQRLGGGVQDRKPFNLEVTSAQDTRRLRQQSQPDITSREDTMRLKGGSQESVQPQESHSFFEITSPEDTLRLKG